MQVLCANWTYPGLMQYLITTMKLIRRELMSLCEKSGTLASVYFSKMCFCTTCFVSQTIVSTLNTVLLVSQTTKTWATHNSDSDHLSACSGIVITVPGTITCY